ncbi:hypothetical protein CC1G_02553 [Coprinopsis cinerea okayama7|uniref:C2H2-type domain-containing protein n=1 Tax=Coprinopsis cinerea (strain Okayama-7 / 130 / ATCC MYA-4618 / FGSC 9003) TaxID=240176 RepID=A8NBU3_COPC7|nr:hypothetical protein CC1G_02553 [Coprinopsis cinerea okayama7\|eukprot:XP_001832291.2 hypothetical protein CC1G_02553 [Coprinopsis cinerea okayama7\
MDGKPFSNVPYSVASTTSTTHGAPHLHRASSAYPGVTQSPQDPNLYQGSQCTQPPSYSQDLYTSASHHHRQHGFGPDSRLNVYPESSQRTPLHESTTESLDFGLPSTINAPHLATSLNPAHGHNHFDNHRGFLPSSTGSQSSSAIPLDHSLPRKRSILEFHSSPRFYTPPHPQPLAYPADYASASTPSGVLHEDATQPLNSFSHTSQNPEISPNHAAPSLSTMSYPHIANTTGHVSSLNLSNPETHHNSNPPKVPVPIPPPIPTSIPMRRASPDEWVSQSQFPPGQQNNSPNEQCSSSMMPIEPHVPERPGTATLSTHYRDANSKIDQLRAPSPSSSSLPQNESKSQSPPPSEEPPTDGLPPKKKKKSKMHTCEICDKKFPRPSGLRTHMNTHNNARPYPCGFPGCTRTFGVRSNAKRHLRTHGVIPQPSNDVPAEAAYVVGFSPPVVSPSVDTNIQTDATADGNHQQPRHQMSRAPFFKLRWMPPSLTSRTNAASLKSVSESGDISDDDDGEDDGAAGMLTLHPPQDGMRFIGAGQRDGNEYPSSASSPSSTRNTCLCALPCSSSPCLSLGSVADDSSLSNSFSAHSYSSSPCASSSSAYGSAVSHTVQQKPRIPVYDSSGTYHSSQVDGSSSFQYET